MDEERYPERYEWLWYAPRDLVWADRAKRLGEEIGRMLFEAGMGNRTDIFISRQYGLDTKERQAYKISFPLPYWYGKRGEGSE